MLRRVMIVDKNARTGKTVDGNVGVELREKTVGIIGTGAIGSRTAELFSAFGCHVLGYNPHPKEITGIINVTMEELLEKSDIITLHCPLNDSTRGLIDGEKIAKMKDGAVSIKNASRGPVVDTKALSVMH